MEAQHVADHEDAAIVPGCLDGTLGIRHGERDRLFDQHMNSRPCRADRVFGVQAIRQCNVHRIDFPAIQTILVFVVSISMLYAVAPAKLV